MLKRYSLILLMLTASSLLFAQPGNPMDPIRGNIKFVSVPPLKGEINVPYVYTAKAVALDSTAVITYSTEHPPQGFTINAQTGVVTWTPTAKGWFGITLFAKTNKGDQVRLEYWVAISGGNGVVQGKVTDVNDVPLAKIIIQLMKAEATDINKGCFSYSAVTDANGKYQISHVDPGIYKLAAISPNLDFASVWYDTATSAKNALPVIVRINETTLADFRLKPGIGALPKVTVSGKITDTLAAALKGAYVFFIRAGFALNSNGSLDNFRKYFDLNRLGDFHMDGKSEFVRGGVTDSLGNYTVTLPVGAYIAFAKAKGYIAEFYNEQTEFLSANTLTLTAITTGINFTLTKIPPVALGGIKGSVIDSLLDVGVPSRVIAFRERNTIGRNAPHYVAETDSLGAFSFNELLPGAYIVLAVPLGGYAPAYYTVADTSLTRWKRATKIVINGNVVENINIYVKALPDSMNGYAGIIGKVRSSNTGLSGAIVVAMKNNSVAGYDITDNAGNYVINGLAPGTYAVTVDKMGYTEPIAKSVYIYYGINGVPSTGSAEFSVESATSVKAVSSIQPATFTLDQNYPNPFNPSTTIGYSIPASGLVTLKIFNIIGQEVATVVNGFQEAGTYNATFNANGFASGVYFYKLQSANTFQTKKMVLMK